VTPRRALPLATALSVGLVVVGGALADPTTWLAGQANVDAWGSWWFQWWVAFALGDGRSPMHSDMLFYPWGKDILRHTGGNILDVVAVLPVRWLLGPHVAWNALVFTAVATNAWVAGRWARRLGAGLAVVLVVELLVGLHPFVLNELRLGRPTQAILAPLLLALAYGDDALRTGDRRATALSAILLALTGWIYWYAASFAAIALGVLALAGPMKKADDAPGLARRLGVYVAIGLGSFVLTSPLVIPLGLSLLRGDVPGLLPLGQWLVGVQDFTTAEGTAVHISTLGPTGGAGLLSAKGWAQTGFVLGIATTVPLLLAPRRWMAVGLVSLAIAAGPFPLGIQNPVYLAFVEALSPFERLYWPVRSVAVLVGVAVVGLVALERLPARLRTGALVGLVVVGIGEPILRDGLPIGRWKIEIPPELDCLEGAGMLLPYGADQEPLVWQTLHESPMLNGMAERSRSLVPAEQQAFRADNTWVSAVLYAPSNPRAERAWTEDDKAAAYDLGYRWVVLRRQELLEEGSRASKTGRLRDAVRALRPLLGAPVRETDAVLIFAPWGGLEACRAP
jgi:hypothetical protein